MSPALFKTAFALYFTIGNAEHLDIQQGFNGRKLNDGETVSLQIMGNDGLWHPLGRAIPGETVRIVYEKNPNALRNVFDEAYDKKRPKP